METFTPGTWEAGTLIALGCLSIYAGDYEIAEVSVDRSDPERGIANAALIAAAPALYEALTRALGVIVEMGNLNGFHTLTDEQLGRAVIEVAQQCSDALALARGEHPTPESRVGLESDAGTRQPNQEKSS